MQICACERACQPDCGQSHVSLTRCVRHENLCQAEQHNHTSRSAGDTAGGLALESAAGCTARSASSGVSTHTPAHMLTQPMSSSLSCNSCTTPMQPVMDDANSFRHCSGTRTAGTLGAGCAVVARRSFLADSHGLLPHASPQEASEISGHQRRALAQVWTSAAMRWQPHMRS